MKQIEPGWVGEEDQAQVEENDPGLDQHSLDHREIPANIASGYSAEQHAIRVD